MSSGQIPLWLPQAGHSRFDNFHFEKDSTNALLIENLRNYLLHGDATPFFMYGESGAGKTHLHIAVASLSRELGNNDTVYFDCGSQNVSQEMLLMCLESSCLCLDNIDLWAGDDAAEQAIFAVVEKAKNSEQRLIVSAKSNPVDNQFKLADLVSRLSSGVVFQLNSLDDKGKLEALRQSVIGRNLTVEDKVLQHLLTHFSRDNHSLFSAIDRLDRASMVEKRKLTIPFVQQVLSTQ